MCSNESSLEVSIFDGYDYNNQSIYNIMQSPGKISLLSYTETSEEETPPFFYQCSSWTAENSLSVSEPSSPLNKSREAKMLKRVKASKSSLNKKKKNKINYNKSQFDYNAACKKIKEMSDLLHEYNG